MSSGGDTYHFCPACKFIWEAKQRAVECHRCSARPVQSITVEQMLEAVELKHAEYCRVCQRIESTDIRPTQLPSFWR